MVGSIQEVKKWLKCKIWGHPQTDVTEGERFVCENCTRCGATVSQERTYYGEAMRWAETHRCPTEYEPQKQITDADGRELEPGDRVKYRELDATFPGMPFGKSGTVQYLFTDQLGNNLVKIEGHRDLIYEKRILGVRRKTM